MVDSNVLLEAANTYYSFKLDTGFWEWLAEEGLSGRIRSLSFVQGEIEFPQELVDWLHEREEEDFFIDASEVDIQVMYTEMSTWIINQPFGPEHIAKFLKGADLWIVAAARVKGATVVTQEKAAGIRAKKIKIPDICGHFGVKCLTTFDLLKELGAQFSRQD